MHSILSNRLISNLVAEQIKFQFIHWMTGNQPQVNQIEMALMVILYTYGGANLDGISANVHYAYIYMYVSSKVYCPS